MENRMRRRMTVILNSKMNMRRFCVSAALLLTTLLAVAENNPYRSDVFWVTVPIMPTGFTKLENRQM